ncbi:hypothetical protein GCM10022224_089320 [Nonomuraea antimicrobica]|uniref:Transposase n=1 Tax=Nonomuraea antimicrobica TaxID=561173 RepID=A0ABP7DU34_9ACTN
MTVGVEDLMHLPFVREWVERGKTEGIAEGKVEGKAEGKVEGKVEGEVRSILLILNARGLHLTDEARTRITECTDPDILESWITKAITATSTDELFD